MFLGLFIVVLIVLYLFVAQHFGAYWGLGSVAAVLAIAGSVLWAITSKLGERLASSATSIIPPAPAPVPELPLRPRVHEPIGLAKFIPELPASASPAERVVHYASTRVANAAVGAIDQAEEVVRTGSRPALLATLAAAAAAGFFHGRNGRIKL